MNTQQPRQPAGITAGGQFATEPKQETTVALAAPDKAASGRYVVTARWHDGSTVYLSYEVDMSQRPTLTRYDEPKPMAERSARRTLRLAERHGEDEMTDVRMEPA